MHGIALAQRLPADSIAPRTADRLRQQLARRMYANRGPAADTFPLRWKPSPGPSHRGRLIRRTWNDLVILTGPRRLRLAIRLDTLIIATLGGRAGTQACVVSKKGGSAVFCCVSLQLNNRMDQGDLSLCPPDHLAGSKSGRAREQFADPWGGRAAWGLSASGGVGRFHLPISELSQR
jgi:hypothetical protein